MREYSLLGGHRQHRGISFREDKMIKYQALRKAIGLHGKVCFHVKHVSLYREVIVLTLSCTNEKCHKRKEQ